MTRLEDQVRPVKYLRLVLTVFHQSLTLRQISSRTLRSARWDRYATANRSLKLGVGSAPNKHQNRPINTWSVKLKTAIHLFFSLPVASTCSYRQRTVAIVMGTSPKEQTSPRYPESLSLMRILLRSGIRSLFKTLYKTCSRKCVHITLKDTDLIVLVSKGHLNTCLIAMPTFKVQAYSDPENSLMSLVSIVGFKKKTVELLHPSLQKNRHSLLTWRWRTPQYSV